MSNVELPLAEKKKNPWVVAGTLMCGLAAIVAGGMQMTKGLSEIFGSGEGAQLQQLVAESDRAIDEANKFNLDAAAKFTNLMKDVDDLGLQAFRKQRSDAARQVDEQFGTAAAEFRTAARKLNEAVQSGSREKFKPYATSKSQSYEFAAEGCEQNQAILRLVLDDKSDNIDDLLPKMQELATRREAALKSSSEAAAQADEMGKEFNGSKEP